MREELKKSVSGCGHFMGGASLYSLARKNKTGWEMGKDTVVIRSEVARSVKKPLMRYPEKVR